ncbi:MAG: hypothetical protein ACOVP1_05925 [Bacteroidia bacterium]
MKQASSSLLLLVVIFFMNAAQVAACSGYKITRANKTIMGSNEDAWRTTPKLWFEIAPSSKQYGAAFTGSRFDGEYAYAPQSGMNEMGLAFERLASFHPQINKISQAKKITQPTLYLKDILHSCKNVEEVKAYIEEYDYSFFLEDVFLYVDQTGKYLVVEPYSLTIGTDSKYLISNFCPSITSEEKAQKLERYRKGKLFVENKIDTSLAFCVALSDTMHVCRKKLGDGTLLSSIWDLNDKQFHLFFYHDYSKSLSFSLKEELAKGNHLLAIDSLFPPNPEFIKLRNYQIPKNNGFMALFILLSAGCFVLSFIFYCLQYFRRSNSTTSIIEIVLIPLSAIMAYYMVVLSGPIEVFYFPAPYVDPNSVLNSFTSYMPFVIMFLIGPMLYTSYQNRSLFKTGFWSNTILLSNTLLYGVLIGLFYYWGFYSVL